MNTCVFVTVSNGIAELQLNRPEKRNAFDAEMIQLLNTHLSKLATDDSIRVLVLSAEGRCFSSGADLNWMKRMARFSHKENIEDAQNLSQLMRLLYEFPHPTIALVQGAAYGGALGLISCCDIALALNDTSFCFSETRLGIMPAVIAPYVIEAIGLRKTKHLFLTALPFDAAEARSIGLITESFNNQEEMEFRKNKLINSILTNSPQALQKTKYLLQDIAEKPLDEETRQITIEAIAKIRVSPEGQEGLQAFLEKRAPSWSNK